MISTHVVIGRVGECVHGVPDGRKVGHRVDSRPLVDHATTSEQDELVKLVEDLRARLMDRRDDGASLARKLAKRKQERIRCEATNRKSLRRLFFFIINYLFSTTTYASRPDVGSSRKIMLGLVMSS